MNNLYEFAIKVIGDTSDEGGFGTAYVVCYSSAPSLELAASKGKLAAEAMGFRVARINDEGRVLPLTGWDSYVESVWPESADLMPNAEQLLLAVQQGEVFFGPFISCSE